MTLSSANIDKPSEFDSETLRELCWSVISDAGLKEVTSADLFGSGANAEEQLLAGNLKLLESRNADVEAPASVTFSVLYMRPGTIPTPHHIDKDGFADDYIFIPHKSNDRALYCRTIKVYLGRDQETLRNLPHSENVAFFPNDFEHNNKGSNVLTASASPVLDRENSFLRIYEQVKPSLLKNTPDIKLRFSSDGIDLHSVAQIVRHGGVNEIVANERGIRNPVLTANFTSAINNSGRSGAYTYRVFLQDREYDGQVSDFPVVITIVEGGWQRKLATHAITCQQKLHEKGIPVAKIYRPVTSYYSEATDQHYYIQEYAKGKHFDLDLLHIEKLGKAMADTHNIPVGEMPEPLTGNVLEPEGLIGEVKRVLEELGKPPEKRKIFSTDEEMVASAKGQLLGRFTWNELRQTPERRDLCKQLNLSRSDAIAYEREQKKQAKLDSGLPTGTCWGDPHLKNLLADEDGNITLLDFQACGEGVLANELTLVSYFFLTNEQGQLDHGRVKAFFEPYCNGRASQDVPGPLTQEEIMAMLQKVHSLSQRQAHPIWVMMRSQGTAMYHGFSQRHAGLKEQIENYMEDGKVTREGADRFAREFLGKELDEFRTCNSENTHLKTVISSRLVGSHGGSFAARG